MDTPRPVVVGSFICRTGNTLVFAPQRGREVAGDAALADLNIGEGDCFGVLKPERMGVVGPWGISGLRLDVELFWPFSLARTVESDDVDIVDSRTESRPRSQSL